MSDRHPGPDFLPYPLPAVSQQTVPLPTAPPAPARTQGRWSTALDGVPPIGVVAIGAGLGAFVLLLLVSGLASREGAGAVVTALAAAVALVTGWVAVRRDVSKDSRTLVAAAQSVGVLSAVVAAMVYAAADTGGQEVRPPLPQPTATSTPDQGPVTPAPTPSTVPPPGSVNGFGVPSDPGSPVSDDPTALGTLQGHVLDTAHRPIAGAVVTITRATPGDTSSTPQCPTRLTTITDADGFYQLKLCQLGDQIGYHVRISVGALVAEHDLYVNSGQTTTYDVLLPR